MVSNQGLFGTDELAYIATNWVSTDHSQNITASAGASYLWTGFNPWIDGTKISATMIYGTGLRSGFANTDHVPPYTQVNLGLSVNFRHGLAGASTTSRSRSASTSSTCSIRFTKFATAAASACSHRNTVRAAAISSAYRKSFRENGLVAVSLSEGLTRCHFHPVWNGKRGGVIGK